MIHYVKDSIFKLNVDILVNPVNAVGQSGAGLARKFKQRFPAAQRIYEVRCKKGAFGPGKILVVGKESAGTHTLIYFSTKDHWQDPSRLEWIEQGLAELATYLKLAASDQSIAIPALGCGLGGLQWMDVKPLIESYLGSLPNTVYAIEPL